jgi:hypothetical protein
MVHTGTISRGQNCNNVTDKEVLDFKSKYKINIHILHK